MGNHEALISPGKRPCHSCRQRRYCLRREADDAGSSCISCSLREERVNIQGDLFLKRFAPMLRLQERNSMFAIIIAAVILRAPVMM